MRHTFWESFQFAGRGLRLAFWSQRTMRIHVGLACAVVVASGWLRLPADEVALLALCMAAVLAAELLNTAVETVVDLQVGDNHHELAGRAKDLSAAAVLVTAVGAAIVGVVVLGPPIAASWHLGHLDAVSVARGMTLLAVLALVTVVLRRSGSRPTRASSGPGSP